MNLKCNENKKLLVILLKILIFMAIVNQTLEMKTRKSENITNKPKSSIVKMYIGHDSGKGKSYLMIPIKNVINHREKIKSLFENSKFTDKIINSASSKKLLKDISDDSKKLTIDTNHIIKNNNIEYYKVNLKKKKIKIGPKVFNEYNVSKVSKNPKKIGKNSNDLITTLSPLVIIKKNDEYEIDVGNFTLKFNENDYITSKKNLCTTDQQVCNSELKTEEDKPAEEGSAENYTTDEATNAATNKSFNLNCTAGKSYNVRASVEKPYNTNTTTDKSYFRKATVNESYSANVTTDESHNINATTDGSYNINAITNKSLYNTIHTYNTIHYTTDKSYNTTNLNSSRFAIKNSETGKKILKKHKLIVCELMPNNGHKKEVEDDLSFAARLQEWTLQNQYKNSDYRAKIKSKNKKPIKLLIFS